VRGRRARRGQSNGSAAGVCLAAARPVDGAGQGSRSRWSCRSERGASSSSAASRTPGRSASPPPADHAAPPSLANHQVSASVRKFRAPTGPRTTPSAAHKPFEQFGPPRRRIASRRRRRRTTPTSSPPSSAPPPLASPPTSPWPSRRLASRQSVVRPGPSRHGSRWPGNIGPTGG
jgi:hypothetical protein